MAESEMDDRERAEYDLMMELDRLESVKEEMEELGVASLAEIEARMDELHRKLDGIEGTQRNSGELRGTQGGSGGL